MFPNHSGIKLEINNRNLGNTQICENKQNNQITSGPKEKSERKLENILR